MKTTDQSSSENEMFEMDNTKAIMIAEGLEDPVNEREFIAAWQHIYDTGLYMRLQGWYGRRIKAMIDMDILRG